jgi:hypothetical protein
VVLSTPCCLDWSSVQHHHIPMPSISLGAAFLTGLLEKDGCLLRDPDLQSMYGLEHGTFDGSLQKLKPMEADSVKALVVAAKVDITILLESEAGCGRLHNNLHQDRKKAMSTWLSNAGITSKIHASIEEVLTLSNCHPRQILENVDKDKSPTMLPLSKGRWGMWLWMSGCWSLVWGWMNVQKPERCHTTCVT